eukprot:CAMPEP_0177664622 /NCGR_PEP_ID=MMETSP0447-20121125/20600_1 /TAXON_ID=0 /ORGANISM="Stygamoeba regulata, Strain BSH-02190019" /LENGTH=367 /DNA_ID=CAMNT_0019170623 /DNA_START=247 /DNA_END=1350 /DNA_ORIENTATION=-
MADVKSRFSELCKLRYRDQAIWFMNGFWNAGINPEEANTVWDYVKHFVELDKMAFDPKGEDGHELDQFWSAKFLEDLNSTLTASERKDALRLIDQDNNGKMSCIEYLTWRYKKSPEAVVNAPQGDNTAAIAAAQAKVDEVQRQLADCEAKIAAQAEAIAAQKKAIADNDAAIKQLQQRQDELAQAIRDLQAARDELERAVEDLKAQEAAFAAKMADLEAKGKGGGVAGARALNELAQMKTEDPLPLRRAKITQEAAVRRVKKQEAATEEAKQEARKQEAALEETKKQLEDAARRLEEAKAALEKAYADLETKMQAAVDELEEIKKNPGGGFGAIWWMEREMFEVDKRLPQAKQRYDHKKPFLFNPGA